MKKILVPIANGSEEMEAVIIVDMLRRAGCEVVLAGDGDVVICSRGIRIVPDLSIDEITDDDSFDAVVLPGGSQGVERFASNTHLQHILARHRAKNRLLAAICAAPAVLHEFGLLHAGAVVTSHPSVANTLEAYTYTLDRVATDGALITSRGAGTAFEFALHIIRMLTGEAAALRIATDIVLYE